MPKKIVGVIPGFNEDSYFLDRTYIKFAKEVMLGKPRIIFHPSDIDGCEEILLPGGRDIDPTLFDEENYASRKSNTEMDKFHISCLDYATETGVNIFGICRGFQMIYYRFLKQLPFLRYEQDLAGHNQSSLDLPRAGLIHKVSRVETLENYFVNSFHHQAVIVSLEGIDAAMNTLVTQYAAPKGAMVLEGVSFTVNNSKVYGVQFHPEELNISQEEFASYSNKIIYNI